MTPKKRIVLCSVLTLLGIGMIGTGTYLQLNVKDTPVKKLEKADIPVEEKLSITLKEIRLPLNGNLDQMIENYIVEPIEPTVLEKLVLDLSKVDVTKVGTYTYTITYKKQVFKGNIIIEEEQNKTPEVTSITLKTISLKLGEAIPQDPSYYIVEALSDEDKAQLKLDLSQVVANKAGTYQYTILYNGMYFTGKITIVEDQPPASAPKDTDKQTEGKDDNNVDDNTDTQDTENKTN